MILDNIAKAAFKLINTVAPFLNPEGFLKAMYKDFESNSHLSDEEIAQIMMGGIKEDKYGFGEKMAEAASYEPATNESFEEIVANNPAVQTVLIGDSVPPIEISSPGNGETATLGGSQQQ